MWIDLTDTNFSVWVFQHHQAIPWYQLNVLQFNSILILSTWRQSQIPSGKGLVPQDCSSAQRSMASPGCCLCLWSPGIDWKFPQSSPRIRFLEQLIELRATFYLLDYGLIIEGYNSGTARWRRDEDQGGGRGWRAPIPSPGAPWPLAKGSPNLHEFTNPEALRTMPFWVSKEASWHRQDWLNHWPLVVELNLSPFSLHQKSGCTRVQLLQSCPTLSKLLDCNLPGSSVHGIFQARILEQVVMPSSRGSSRSRDRTHTSYVSCIAGGFFTHSTTWEVREWDWKFQPSNHVVVSSSDKLSLLGSI